MNQPPTPAAPKTTAECASIVRGLANMPVVKALVSTPDIALFESALQTLTERAEKSDRADRADLATKAATRLQAPATSGSSASPA